jgi:hypothetical protein
MISKNEHSRITSFYITVNIKQVSEHDGILLISLTIGGQKHLAQLLKYRWGLRFSENGVQSKWSFWEE